MSQEARASRRHVGTQTLQVKVGFRPGSRNPIQVQPITLTNSIGKVVWYCPDLPEGARLQIVFPKDQRGPFMALRRYPGEIVGLGNRGPDETSRKYTYKVRIRGIGSSSEATPELALAAMDEEGGTEQTLEGKGDLLNEATNEVCPDPPIEDPPY